MIKAIYFDYGGVLALNGRPGMVNRAIGRAMGLEGAADIVDLLDDLKINKISSDVFIDSINARYSGFAGKSIDNSIWQYEEIGTIYDTYEPMYELGRQCRDRGLITGVLSNIFPIPAQLIREKGLYDGFDPVVLSCDESLCKPDPRFYKVAENRIPDVKPQEILLIDDQDKCIAEAQARGWQTVQVDVLQPGRAIAQVMSMVGIKQ